MISALRGAVMDALRREEESLNLYIRLGKEATDKIVTDFFSALENDIRKDLDTLKRLNLYSIVKFGLAIKFVTSSCNIDEKGIKEIKDVAGTKELLKLAESEINTDIEYYEHISNHSLFPEVKRLFRILADKELEHKCKIRALQDLLA